MPRQRLRPDWGTHNQAYRVWFLDNAGAIGAPPQAVWDAGHAMNRLWNDYCFQFRQVRRAEPTDDKGQFTLRGKARAAHYASLLQGLHQHAQANYKDKLSPPLYESVANRFYQTVKRWLVKPQQFGPPRPKEALDSIRLTFKDKNGGTPVARFSGAGKPTNWAGVRDTRHLAGQPDALAEYLANGFFYLGNALEAPQRLNLHVAYGGDRGRYPLPGGAALVKEVVLSGKHTRPFGWEWRLIFTLETPPVAPAPRSGHACVGLDWGYRLFEDRVRFGVLYDGTAFYELFVPLDLSSQRDKRRAVVVQTEDGGRVSLPTAKRVGPREIWALEAQIGAGVEACKTALKAADQTHWPATAKRMLSGLVKMREVGLLRLQWELAQHEIAVPVLDEWAAQNRALFKQVRNLEIQLLRTRQHLMRNVMTGLARQCAVIAREGDLGLKALAEQAGKDKQRRQARHADTGEWEARTPEQRITEAAQKYRGFVCLSDAQRFLREAVAKTGTLDMAGPAAGTTNVCAQCEATIETGPDLRLVCANGHYRDQDGNAAQRLYARIDTSYTDVATPLDLSLLPAQALRGIRRISYSELGD